MEQIQWLRLSQWALNLRSPQRLLIKNADYSGIASGCIKSCLKTLKPLLLFLASLKLLYTLLNEGLCRYLVSPVTVKDRPKGTNLIFHLYEALRYFNSHFFRVHAHFVLLPHWSDSVPLFPS